MIPSADNPRTRRKNEQSMGLSLAEVNDLDRDGFVAALGGVFEHSPWVAAAVWSARPFADVADLNRAMVAAVDAADTARQLALLRAHPDLAGKAARAGALTAHSTAEQAGAGLDRLSDAEYERFHALNDAYREKFRFPFIIAVKGHTKETILMAFAERLNNTEAQERASALAQVAGIARFRLEAMLGLGAAP